MPRDGAPSYSREASPERHPRLDNLGVLAYYYYSLFQRGQITALAIKKICLLPCPCSAPCPPSVHGPTTSRWAVSSRMQVTGWSSGPLLNAYLCSEINSMGVSRYIRSTNTHAPTMCRDSKDTQVKSLLLTPCCLRVGEIETIQIISGANKSSKENPSRQVVRERRGPV